MTEEEAGVLRNGLYRLYWTTGGMSVAAVGRDHRGRRWYAPTNWITVPEFDWSQVQRVELITTQRGEESKGHDD